MKRKIIFFHMLNDYSGSPNVLSLIIKGLIEKGYEVELYSSDSISGFLSGIEGMKYNEVFYKFSINKMSTLILFIYAQIRYFLAVLKYRNEKNTIIYINTILPFGAALGTALTKNLVIYHIHEKPVTKNFIQNFAIAIFMRFSDKSIFVSKYLFDSFDLSNNKKILIYNSLSPEFSSIAKNSVDKTTMNCNILMICSLRTYKGVLIFIDLASKLSKYSFILVLNANNDEIAKYFNLIEIPSNLHIYPTQNNLHSFYKQADLVVNLSLTNEWVETFGLTALEAMSYGIPVIVPPIGGIAEIIDDGVQGFKIDSREIYQLIDKITLIFSDSLLYEKMSEEARVKAGLFSYNNMIDKVEQVINL